MSMSSSSSGGSNGRVVFGGQAQQRWRGVEELELFAVFAAWAASKRTPGYDCYVLLLAPGYQVEGRVEWVDFDLVDDWFDGAG